MRQAKSVSNLPSSYIREILSAATSPCCISLAGGLPSEALFPFDSLCATFDELATHTQEFTSLYQYGLTAGYPPLVNYLKEQYRLAGSFELVVTNGSQQGIDLIARSYVDPGDLVLMEAPSYLGAIQTFALARSDIRTVQQNESGPILAQIEEAFKADPFKIFYAVPDFHNPSGVCWSLEVRKCVAELCERYNVLLVEDVPYRELRFTGTPLPLVSEFCPNHSMVLRSFSKTTVPGLRLGSLVGPKPLVEPLIRAKQAVDLHTNSPAQHILLKLLSKNEFPQHIESIKKVYGSRYQSLCHALENHVSEFGRYSPVEGGMFIWFELNGIDTDILAKKALEKGVAVVPSSVFYTVANRKCNAVRLNFSHSSEERIELAITRLRSSLLGMKP